jgi:hypothetical protein
LTKPTSTPTRTNAEDATVTVSSPTTADLQHKLPTLTCVACYEETQCYSLACEHGMCGKCVSQLFLAATVDSSLMPPRCCKVHIGLNVATLVMSPEDSSRFHQAHLEHITPTEKKMYCPRKACSQFILLDLVDTSNSGGIFSCPACNEKLCARCRKVRHQSLTCEQQAGIDSDGGDGLFSRLTEKQQWKKCSSCHATIELSQGCNHMTCKCGYQFCYRCGTKWSVEHECSSTQ